MKVSEIKTLIIPEIATFCNAPIIMADDMGDIPKVPHATYKFTSVGGKGVGQAQETAVPNLSGGLDITRIEEKKMVISFTSYAMDEDESVDLAQEIHDWFSFHGYDVLNGSGIVVSDQTSVANRDAFVVENYERRNGFDVILKVMVESTRSVDWFNKVEANRII